MLLKQKHRHFRTLLSIGGWTYSSNFAPGTNSTEKLRNFATSAVSLLKDCGFDGLDVDWEYPQSATEAQQYTKLLHALRYELDQYAASVGQPPERFLLSVACPAGPSNFQRLDVRGMNQFLDFWNLMAYDYAGSWDARAGHQANLFPSNREPGSTPFNTQAAIDFYMANGVDPSKLVIGCPLYGRAFANTKGPGHSFSGTGEGSWEQGVWDWKALPLENSKVEMDPECAASWCLDAKGGLLGGGKGTMVSFDTMQVAEKKAQWVREKGLGGLMWWESSGDRKNEGSMIGHQVATLGTKNMDGMPNTIEYPHSKFENLRNGFR